MKKLRYLIVILALSLIGTIITGNLIKQEATRLLLNKELKNIERKYDLPERDRGSRIMSQLNANGNVLIFGSSELNSKMPYNIKFYYPNSEIKCRSAISGKSFTQTLQHSSAINSIENINKNSKVVIFLSVQWFINNNGIENKDFTVNFSPLQFYKYLNDSALPKDLKMKYAARHFTLLSDESQFKEEKFFSYLNMKDDPFRLALRFITKPYFSFKSYLLDIKDCEKVIENLSKEKGSKEEINAQAHNFDAEIKKALEYSMASTRGNELSVDDLYYRKHLNKIYKKQKDRFKDIDINKSEEFNDLVILTETLKAKGIEPIVTTIPVNGKYYDYLGVSNESRQILYSRINKLMKEKNIKYIDYSDKDYEKYFLEDVIHPGGKGWLEFDRESINYFKNRENK